MKTLKKSTLASLVGAAALATAGAANATIVVGGADGYEFSVDGNINQFFTASDADSVNGSGAGTGGDSTRLRNGLLPTFFGFNVSAPEINGLKVGARVSISPSTNGGSYFGDRQDGNAMEQREAFATVDGSFGQVMLGKGLGLYSAKNILNDQTLYGVGAVIPGDASAGITGADNNQTTLGRIGYGYDYANWRSQIKWTSPDMSGFKLAVAILDGEEKGEANGTFGSGLVSNSIERDEPRYEAEISYATDYDNGTFMAWLSGMTQTVRDTTLDQDLDSQAYTVGTKVTFSGLEFVGTYYDNEGVGDLGGVVHGTSHDSTGDEREGDGYYVQLGYRFGGATLVSASHGQSTLDLTSAEKSGVDTSPWQADERSLTTIGVYHDVTQNLKLVAEYSRQEDEFHSGLGYEDQDTDIFSLGGFISW